MKQFAKIFDNMQTKVPLVHFITNYVSVNDCANITLAIGGSPIMADDIHEAEQIVTSASALVINIGTLNAQTVEVMLAAGKQANKLKIPIILDPVGVGTSEFRNKTIETLMKELDFSVIKGNISEIKFLSDGISSTIGVDARSKDLLTEETMEETVVLLKKLSRMAGSVIVVTGKHDIIASSKEVFVVRNGNPMMGRVTGTGCMCGAVIACLVGANPKNVLKSTVAAVSSMGICGELAFDKLKKSDGGLNTYRSLIIDYIGKIDFDNFNKYQKIECYMTDR